MTEAELKLKCPNFSVAEIERTGDGKILRGTQPATLIQLQAIRSESKKPIRIVQNGLITGGHSSPEHPQGDAVDWYFSGAIDFDYACHTVKRALWHGFTAVGLYWNGNILSFHTANRMGRVSLWSATPRPNRKAGESYWIYHNLFANPQDFYKKP